MLLCVVNYRQEIDERIFQWFNDFDLQFMNETKWSVFGFKLMKLLNQDRNKYDMVLHFWLCGWSDSSQIWNIYKIDRSFLYYYDIIDNQRFRFGSYKFDTIPTNNIVTKFHIWEHDKKLFDFADLYDLESFWVSQVSALVSIPVFTIKWVSDLNEICTRWVDSSQEIDFLMSPNNKRKKKELLLQKIGKNIELVNLNLQKFIQSEFVWFHRKYVEDKEFRKKLLT